MESGAAGPSVPDPVVLDLERLMWREVAGEIVVLDKRTWTYMGINGSGALLWRELVEGASRERLVDRLREEYGLAEDVALRDVGAFVELLRGHDLLTDASCD